ncbi:MAG: SDR family oxidoreductase [Bacillota bacterium]|nr:SDR family oxidoreductase [Bacillota bacterium]
MKECNEYWQDKVAIITGATHGIGLRLAERLAEKGVKIATIYKSNDEQAQNFINTMTALNSESIIIKGDITEKSNLNKLVESVNDKWGKIDFLVNNVGTDIWAPISELSEEDWLLSQEIILNVPFRLIKLCLPIMHKQNFGRIITMGASSRNYMEGQANLAPFGINKGALTIFTKTLALEEIHNGITVNMVAPGSTAESGVNKEEDRIPLSKIPIGRRMTREEVTEAILYFLSKNAECVTGQFIGINGGCST